MRRIVRNRLRLSRPLWLTAVSAAYLPLLAGCSPYSMRHGGGMGYGGGMPGMWGGGWYGWILSILFWVLLIAAFVWAVKWVAEKAGHGAAGKGDSAMEILRRRYAGGEITKEEFDRMKEDLKDSG